MSFQDCKKDKKKKKENMELKNEIIFFFVRSQPPFKVS